MPLSHVTTGDLITATTWNAVVDAVNGAQPALCDGRLTLTSGTPITSADVTAATTLYFTPYKGNRIALYNGSTGWDLLTFTEVSIALPAFADFVFDVFAYNSGGAVALEFRVWTNQTTRAVALSLQDGVYVKSDATTRRYLGTIKHTSVSGQSEDSATKRYLWNYYNRVRRPLVRQDSTTSWNYTTATYRQANASSANQVDLVVGVAESLLDMAVVASASNSSAGITFQVAIGEDSTTTPIATSLQGMVTSPVAAYFVALQAIARRQVPIGRHFYVWLEYSGGAGTTTWWGAGGAGSGQTSGMYGSIDC